MKKLISSDFKIKFDSMHANGKKINKLKTLLKTKN